MAMNEPAPSLPRAALPLLISTLIVLLAALLMHTLRPYFDQPVKGLRVDGALHKLRAEQIAIAAGLQDMRLFEVDLSAVRARVEALPWVAHARISRIWPDRIAIRVVERVPYARWGLTQLIDTESRVFTPAADALSADLPQLSAPAGREAEAAMTFQRLREVLGASAFVPSGLSVDARGEWRLATARGIELRLGQGEPLKKTDLLLGAVSRAMADQLSRIAYIDLRYSNGFSVGWIDGGACESALRAARTDRQKAAAAACVQRAAVPVSTAATKPEVGGDPARTPPVAAEDKKHE